MDGSETKVMKWIVASLQSRPQLVGCYENQNERADDLCFRRFVFTEN